MIALIIAALCLIYYVVIVSYSGFSTSFSWVWLVAAVVSVLVYVSSKLLKRGVLPHTQSLAVKVSFYTTIGLVGVLAVIIETMVLIGMFSQTKADNLDYLIVLGTRVEGDEPSKSLQYRLDKAIEYLKANDNLKVIVSGGQTGDAQVTEAYAMASYLMDAGASPRRILLENKATSTRENLILSERFIKKENAKVGLITNSFHVTRSVLLAEELGYDVVGIAAPSDKVLLLNDMVREFFVIIKEKIMGYI